MSASPELAAAAEAQQDGVARVLSLSGWDDLAAVMLTAAPGSRDAARLVEVVGAAEERAVVRVGQSGPG